VHGLCSWELLLRLRTAVSLYLVLCPRILLNGSRGYVIKRLCFLCARDILLGFWAAFFVLLCMCSWAVLHCTGGLLLSQLHGVCCWQLFVGTGTVIGVRLSV